MSLALTIEKVAQSEWEFTWDDESGVSYDIYLNGVWLETVTEGSFTSRLPDYVDTPPAIEVVPEDEIAQGLSYPPFLLLQWRRVAGAVAYKVEEYVGAAWIQRRMIMDTGQEYISCSTRALTDGTTAQWRVRAMDAQGGVGTAVVFTILVCRNPAEPGVVMDYELDGDLTISAEESV